MPRLKTAQTAKVIIDLWHDPDWVREANIKRLLDVTISPWRMSLAEYLSRDDYGRKRMCLEALYQGLVWLARIEGWPTEPFDVAREGCLTADLINDFYYKKGKVWKNPAGTAGVRIFCRFWMRDAVVWAVVVDRRKRELGRELIAVLTPSDYIVYETLRTFRWIDDSTVALQSWDQRGREEIYRCDLSHILRDRQTAA